MLNAMREGAKSGIMKFILFGLLVLAVFGLVLTDVGGFFRGGTTKTGVARIDGHEISIVSFDRTLRRILAQQNIDPATAYQMGFVAQVLRSEINSFVTQKAAYDLGLQISEDTIAIKIAEIVQPYVTEGMTAQQAFASILRSQNMTEREFIRSYRAETANALLRNTFLTGANAISGKEAVQLYLHAMETRTVDYVYIPHSQISDIPESSDDTLRAFYEAGKERYAIPETRSFTIAVLDPSKQQDEITVTEEELREIYEQKIDNYSLPERRVLEQAIFSEHSIAADVAAHVRQGQSLKDAVRNVTGNEEFYIGEQPFERNGLLENIADVVFDYDKGATTDPIETALGWHVVTVKDILPPSTQSFDSIKDNLRTEITADRSTAILFEMANNIDDQLASGAPLEEIAETTSLELTSFKNLRADGSTLQKTEGLKGFDEDRNYILETVFELYGGETAPVIELDNNIFATIRVDEITPKAYIPFEDVKDTLKTQWDQDQREVANRLQAIEAIRNINNGDTTLSEFAKHHNTTVKNIVLSRNGDPESPLTINTKNILMNNAQGEYTLAPADSGYVVAYIKEVTLPPQPEADDSTVMMIAQQQAIKLSQEAFQIYMAYLEKKYKIVVNERLLQQTYDIAPIDDDDMF